MRFIPGRLVVISLGFLLCFIFNSGCASVTFERGHPRVYKLEHILAQVLTLYLIQELIILAR